MKKYFLTALMSVLIFGAVLSSVIVVVGAAEKTSGNETVSNILKTDNEPVNQSANEYVNKSALENKTSPSSATETSKGSTTKQKFRVGPTVVLRPVNDVVTKGQDGLVELYVDNPSLNEVTLNVDARITVPSGIQVYGQGFGQADAAGTVYGTFSVPPGKVRTININVKGEKAGTYTIHFSGMYWPGDNKDNYNPISLSHPFVVKEPSSNAQETSNSGKTGGVKAQGSGSFSIPGFGLLIALMGLLTVYIVRRK